jgi:hypothetical protein
VLDANNILRFEPPIAAGPGRRCVQTALLLAVGDPSHEGVVVFFVVAVSVLPLLHTHLLCILFLLRRTESKKEKRRKIIQGPYVSPVDSWGFKHVSPVDSQHVSLVDS